MTNNLHPAPALTLCPRCGKNFTCNPSGKCWCSSVFVPPHKLSELTGKYSSCLCPDCLNEIAQPKL
ncbi:MAG TPA: cysteine-rich CWC family protein [Bacteroidales bacterium]|nr:cysteine-rich CWC family protein [Bacteroidales bacterium]